MVTRIRGARGPKSGHHVYKADRRDWWFLCDWWLWDLGGTIGVLRGWRRGDGDFAHSAPLYAPGDQNPGPESLESGHFVHKVNDRGWCDWGGLARGFVPVFCWPDDRNRNKSLHGHGRRPARRVSISR